MAYTPERAYRVAVVPLAIFFFVGGLILFTASALIRVPITSPFPFVESDVANRIIFILLSLATIAFGIGLYLKSRAAWLSLLAYIVVGTIVISVGVILDPRFENFSSYFYVPGILMNAAFAVGIYLATAPAFRRNG